MSNEKAQARAAFVDPAARELRASTLAVLIRGLDDAGQLLRVAGSLVGAERDRDYVRDSDVLGIGYAASTCAALLGGIQSLLPSNVYAAAALLRQVAEVEYLGWAFANDDAQARAWFQSTKKERLQMWQPGALRKRSGGVFRDVDYWMHCEQGGHPTPDGCRALLNSPTSWTDALTVDALIHGAAVWSYVLDAVDRTDSRVYPSERRLPVTSTLAHWRSADPVLPFADND